MDRYQDFVIRISTGRQGSFWVHATSPVGEVSGSFRLPFDEKDLKIFMLEVGRPRSASRRGRIPDFMRPTVDFGHNLYKAVIDGDVRDLFLRSVQNASRQEQGLRIRLWLNDAPELAHLPWEYLYDGRDFLALSDASPLVRYLDLPNPPRKLAVDLPLRILVTISAPTDLPPLDVQSEKAKINQALSELIADGLVEVEYTDNASLSTLQRVLRRAKRANAPFHIWHYIGHGHFDPEEQASLLALTNEQGMLQMVSGFELGTLLQNFSELRLALLNACEGARSSSEDPFAGVSAALVERDIPAVIAMQFEITDQAAIVFATEFYSALVDGLALDAAVTNARRAIFFMPNYAEWATPVLYLRSSDSLIFDIVGKPVSRPIQVDDMDTQARQDEAQRVLSRYVKGLSDFYLERWESAVQNLQAVVETQPDYEDAAEKLAEAKVQLALKSLYDSGLNALERRDWSQAIQALGQLAERDPNYKDTVALLAEAQKNGRLGELYNEARLLFEAGQWQAVLTVFKRLDEIDPDYPDPEKFRSQAEENCAKQAREVRLRELYTQAVMGIQKMDFAAAQEALEELLGLNPDYEDAASLLGKVKNERAQQDRDQELNELYTEALIKINEGKFLEAKRLLEKIVGIDPEYEETATHLAKTEERLLQKGQTHKKSEAETESSPEANDLFIQARRAVFRFEWDQAQSLLKQLQEMDPQYEGLQPLILKVNRGIVHQKRNEELRNRLLKETEIPMYWWVGFHILAWALISTGFYDLVFLSILGLIIYLVGPWVVLRKTLVQGAVRWTIIHVLGMVIGLTIAWILFSLFDPSADISAGFILGISFAISAGIAGYWQTSELSDDLDNRIRWARINTIQGGALFLFFISHIDSDFFVVSLFVAVIIGTIQGLVTGSELNRFLENLLE